MALETHGSKRHRLEVIFTRLNAAPRACSSLAAYKLLQETIDQVEDEFLGAHTYDLKLTRAPLVDTGERMYVTQLESIVPIPGYTGVHLLISSQQHTFISRFGAIEVQRKLKEDKEGEILYYRDRHKRVLFKKSDGWGDDVWHLKNL